MSLITPIDWRPRPLLLPSINRGYFWPWCSSSWAPGEEGRGPPGRVTYEEGGGHGCQKMPQDLEPHTKGALSLSQSTPFSLL